jgi:HD-GYP domain-containing protein (c-di-GMP phosphodiesterase class II)
MRLRGVSGPIKGQVWDVAALLRVGRLATFELILDDPSVSRRHAEVVRGEDGWVVCDLESTNGTYVNGTRLTATHPLTARDIVQFGKVAFLVEITDAPIDGAPSDQLVMAASHKASFGDGIQRLVFGRDQMPRAGEELLALLRAGHHMVHLESEDQLLDSILNDAVSVLDAQRGAIVLGDGDGPDPKLKLRALAVGNGESKGRFHFSKRLTTRCYTKGESALYTNIQDDRDLMNQSIADGAMSSVLCVLLRTPRRKLGVLHLDRGFFQDAFTEDDLVLADALAAHASAGIECALLLRKQRELFLNTIMVLAQMVELRDEYTGGHTQRVTKYAIALGERMELPNDQLELIRTGTPLHDVGKIGIPDVILRKPGRLTAQEFAVMQTHTTLGSEYLSTIPELHPIIPIVRNHHERWDGTGYPDRLAKTNIPFLARIVAVCDAFDAMTSDRPYHVGKKGRPPEEAFDEVAAQAGRQFDPDCAAAFLDIRDDIVRDMYELMPGSRRPTSTVADGAAFRR